MVATDTSAEVIAKKKLYLSVDLFYKERCAEDCMFFFYWFPLTLQNASFP